MTPETLRDAYLAETGKTIGDTRLLSNLSGFGKLLPRFAGIAGIIFGTDEFPRTGSVIGCSHLGRAPHKKTVWSYVGHEDLSDERAAQEAVAIIGPPTTLYRGAVIHKHSRGVDVYTSIGLNNHGSHVLSLGRNEGMSELLKIVAEALSH